MNQSHLALMMRSRAVFLSRWRWGTLRCILRHAEGYLDSRCSSVRPDTAEGFVRGFSNVVAEEWYFLPPGDVRKATGVENRLDGSRGAQTVTHRELRSGHPVVRYRRTVSRVSAMCIDVEGQPGE